MYKDKVKERETKRRYAASPKGKAAARRANLNHRAKPGMKFKYVSSAREWRHKYPARVLLQFAKSRAKRRGVPFDLRPEDVIIPAVCPVLGIAIISGLGYRHDQSPSIDRFYPGLGYVRGNVRVISVRANTLKNNATIAELEAVLRYVRGGP